jgi:hypothetical protein
MASGQYLTGRKADRHAVDSGSEDVDSLMERWSWAERQKSPLVGFHIADRLKILGQEVGLPLGPLIFTLRWNEPIHGLNKT